MMSVAEIELHDEIASWFDSLSESDWDRAVVVLLTAFRKQRDTERLEVARARRAAEACAVEYP